MALRKLERRNYGGKWPMSIKYQNLLSFKERLILLCQSILETRRITHLHGSARFTISLNSLILDFVAFFSKMVLNRQNFKVFVSLCKPEISAYM